MLKANLKPVRSTGSIVLALFVLICAYAINESAQAQSLKATIIFSDTTQQKAAPVNDFLAEPEAPKITLSPKSQRMVDKFVRQNEEALKKIANRSEPYFKTIDAIFKKQGLPLQLKYLAIVESNLKSTAVSHCGATGVWQLMPETARNYGLKINRYIDERKHVSKSTVAAAKYLQSLYAQFGDWLLVIAAYNGGSGSVRSAMRKSGSKNYYALHRYLPAETKAHVEHFIATHYYFEGEGSVVTLTKVEAGRHVQKVSDYLTKRTCEKEEAEAIAAVTAVSTPVTASLKE